MNSLLNNKWHQPQRPSFKEFANSITPQGAKQKIEEMLTNGELSQEKYQQAQQIANMLFNK